MKWDTLGIDATYMTSPRSITRTREPGIDEPATYSPARIAAWARKSATSALMPKRMSTQPLSRFEPNVMTPYATSAPLTATASIPSTCSMYGVT